MLCPSLGSQTARIVKCRMLLRSPLIPFTLHRQESNIHSRNRAGTSLRVRSLFNSLKQSIVHMRSKVWSNRQSFTGNRSNFSIREGHPRGDAMLSGPPPVDIASTAPQSTCLLLTVKGRPTAPLHVAHHQGQV